ncbi:MAG: phage tail sheath C-terminal domain-containing protein [Kofleriaceae bacterium]
MATSYLSPGVYVEETDTGNKPIEGVSTSTAGVVGVTERGPANVPTLITSFGDYRRTFGGYLSIGDFTDPSGRAHCYLPHGVEGLFVNGGKRVYVTRVIADEVTRAARRLFFDDPLLGNPPATVLLRPAEESTGTSVNPPLLYTLAGDTLANPDTIRIGDGSRAEYRTVVTNTLAPFASLNLPLQGNHIVGASVVEIARAVDPAYSPFTLPSVLSAGDTHIVVASTTPADVTALAAATGELIEIGALPAAEYVMVASATQLSTTQVRLNLEHPLQLGHTTTDKVTVLEVGTVAPDLAYSGGFTPVAALAVGDTSFQLTGASADITLLNGNSHAILLFGPTVEEVEVASISPVDATHTTVTLAHPITLVHPVTDIAVVQKLTPPGAAQVLVTSANGGDSIVFVDGGTFTTTTDLVVIDPGANQEIRRIGTLRLFTPALPPYEDYPAGSVIDHVTAADDTRNVQAGATVRVIPLDNTALLEPGMQLVFAVAAPSAGTIAAVSATNVTLLSNLGAAPAAASVAIVQPRTLTAAAAAGAMTIQLDARIGLGLDPDNADVLRIGVAPNHELVTVLQLSEPRAAAPDAGAVVLSRALERSYPAGTEVRRETITADAARQATKTILDAPATATTLLVADGSNYVANETVRVTLPSGAQFFHVIDVVADAKPQALEVDVALVRSHTIDATIVKREQLFAVRALDTGGWGNRVLVTAADEEAGLLPRAEVNQATASPGPGIPSTMRLNTVTGVEAGTVIELRSADGTTQVGDLLKVKAIDRSANNLVILDAPGLSPAQVAAVAAALPKKLTVRSREFRMQVMLLKPPSPAIPIRNEELLDSELFRTLSMDPRHSHYFMRIIGATFVDGAATDDLGIPLRRSDRRSEGGSQYVRVYDLGTSDADKERVRLGPEDLIDTLPSGLTRPARLRLGDGESSAVFGDDSVALMDDAMYLGLDDREPAARTGIYALKNALDVSLIAVPGQVTAAVQQALIDQCEDLRYRFAVLDAHGPADDTIDDITAQRQQFDTKYAAFYHPWLTIPDPFPTNLASIAQYPVPPSGHILGIYARTDEQRGVHKAPANEVVAGMTGLTRYLNQSEQDVLNAYPVNIDVIRDFRVNSRGIRVWGARVITSDTDWKYVNVRRLMIFIEESLDRGLQWVVFEPNDEKLWARVRRSVSNFLTTVWRNGALEGDTKDQAFYVKCDRTTMTQDDIDNGRLICVVGVSPVKPAEFVIIRIGLWTADASS